jgi:replicative DNA helicase
MDRKGLREVIEEAHEWHHRLVIIDHIHHMDHGDGPENRGIRETMRLAKTLAKRYDMGILFTAQLNRGDTRDRRRKFYPPELSDLMGASAIEQVADGVLLLYRPLQAGIKVGDIDDVIMGQREWRTVFQANTIAVRCAKHRLDGDQRNKDALLTFERARITDESPRVTERGDAYE